MGRGNENGNGNVEWRALNDLAREFAMAEMAVLHRY